MLLLFMHVFAFYFTVLKIFVTFTFYSLSNLQAIETRGSAEKACVYFVEVGGILILILLGRTSSPCRVTVCVI